MSKLHSMVPFRVALLGLALAASSMGSLVQNYCSNENTGSGYAAVLDLYQSNGACYDQCKSQYAFAIVQYKSCWCSNYLPADQQSVGSCDQTCPGYPSDKCGDVAAGLYGYIALPNPPSGTIGAAANSPTGNTYASYGTQPVSTIPTSSPTSSTLATETTSLDPTASVLSSAVSTTAVVSTALVTAPNTVASSTSSLVETSSLTSIYSQFSSGPPQPYSPTSESTSTSPAPTSYTPSTPSTQAVSTSSSASSSSLISPIIVPVAASTEVVSDPPTATVTPTPVTSVRVVTVSGAMVTQTITSTPSVAAGSNPDNDAAKLQRKGLSGGAIAGAVIGTLLGVAALILGACLLWRRKKRSPDGEVAAEQGMKRNTSVLSRTGLLVRNRPISMAENNNADDPLYANTGTGNSSVRHSMLFGAGAMAGEGVSPVSPLGSATEQGSSRRYSRPLVYDQRLNPSALFANTEGNGSRISIQDQQDYSRPLGITNPDPRVSTDSRQ